MDRPLKTAPAYAIASVDHALRLATMLQLEDSLSVSEAAERLGVARSTAHRLLAMLVYRDFAVRGPDRRYRSGPVLELAQHSGSLTARLRVAALPHLERLAAATGESTHLSVRYGPNMRGVASAEAPARPLRVGSREGMVFPANRSAAGLLLMSELSAEELAAVYASPPAEVPDWWPDLDALRRELAVVRRNGFAVNNELSERGVVVVAVPVVEDGTPVAGLSIGMPSVRYDEHRLRPLVGTMRVAAADIARDLAASRP